MADKIEAEVAEWSSDANEAVELAMVRPGSDGPVEVATFHPRFTYPIFGDEESIFGYKDLNIKISFAAHNLAPHVEIAYSKKFKPVGDVKAPNLKSILSDFLPKEAFDDNQSFNTGLQEQNGMEASLPPGERVHSYKTGGRTFEIWLGELSDPAVRKLIDRIQIMVSFYIEGGVPLNLKEEAWSLARWRVFFVWEKMSEENSSSPYSFAGYATSYRFGTFPPTGIKPNPLVISPPSAALDHFPPKEIAISSLPNRSRISQFLILPHVQGHGIGRHLYHTMVKTFTSDSACIEITVEDPNEAFDDLRDCCDFYSLTQNGNFAKLPLNITIDAQLLGKTRRVPTGQLYNRALNDELRAKNKIEPRQWARLLELYWLSQIPAHSRQAGTARLTQKAKAKDPGDKALYLWRLLIKQRIYKQNKDIMSQFEQAERLEKLEMTLQGQVDDYERLLRKIEERGTMEDGPTMGSSAETKRKKRQVIDDDDDSVAGSESKRARMDETE